jgi:protoheme IX farnesyltransferase
LAFSIVISVAGLVHLLILVNGLTALLAAATLVSYVFLYTPLKQKSSLSTVVGAIPGALPPLGSSRIFSPLPGSIAKITGAAACRC